MVLTPALPMLAKFLNELGVPSEDITFTAYNYSLLVWHDDAIKAKIIYDSSFKRKQQL